MKKFRHLVVVMVFGVLFSGVIGCGNPQLDILLSNDDGWSAPGIQIMCAALTAAGHNVTVVAPKEDNSGKGGAICTDTDAVIEVVQIDATVLGATHYPENAVVYSVDSTPADCISVAMDVVGVKPDLVISGSNFGQNLSKEAVATSGTVNVALAAARKGIPAIAVSVGIDINERDNDLDGSGTIDAYEPPYPFWSTFAAFEPASVFTIKLIVKLYNTFGPYILPQGKIINVNVPVPTSDDTTTEYISLANISNFVFNWMNIGGGFAIPVPSFIDPTDPSLSDDIEGDTAAYLAGKIAVSTIDIDATSDTRPSLPGLTPTSTISGTTSPLDILLANDDGWDAPGIVAMYGGLTQAGHMVTVVAPLNNNSGKGGSISTDYQTPIAVVQAVGTDLTDAGYPSDAVVWSVDSTPSDCVKAALDVIGVVPDLVVSGSNFAMNLARETTAISGTVNVALSVARKGIPAVAVSVGLNFDEAYDTPYPFSSTFQAFEPTASFTAALIEELVMSDPGIMPTGTILNVNIPVASANIDGTFTALSFDEIGKVTFVGLAESASFEFTWQDNGDGTATPGAEGVRNPFEMSGDTLTHLQGNIPITRIDVDMTAKQQLNIYPLF